MNDQDRSLTTFALADLVLLLAECLRCSPSDRCPSAAALDQLAAAADAGSRIRDAFRAIAREASRTSHAEWQSEQTRLFEGPVACPINETAYVRRDKGAIIGDICGFYLAFGVEPDETCGEKADHIQSELEYVVAMLVLHGQALRAGERERVEITAGALGTFLREHLGEWIGRFAGRLEASTGLALHLRWIDALRLVWDLLATRYDAPTFDTLPGQWVDAPEDDGTPYECDMAIDPQAGPGTVPLTGPAGTGLPSAN